MLGSPVRGLQAGTVQEGEPSVALPQKMIGQTSIPQGAVATLQAPIEPGFQSSAGHGYALVADLFLLTTIALLQSLLHQGWYLTRKLCFLLCRQKSHFPTASQPMGQAALVQGMHKPTIDGPAVAHQKIGKEEIWLHRFRGKLLSALA